MKFNYQESANKPGIYKIVNTHTNRIYIGQAKDFKKRWHDHKRYLLDSRHRNKFILNDFNKCRLELGHTDFLEFHVLEVMEGSTKEERNLREEFYIKAVWDHQELCYNFEQKVESKERSCYSSTPEETRKKSSDSAKASRARPEVKAKHVQRMKDQWQEEGRKDQLSERMKEQWEEPGRKESYGQKIKTIWADGSETREKLLEVRKRPDLVELFKKNCHTPEALAKMAAKQTKNHGKIVSPDGQVFQVIGLKKFCLEHGLGMSSIANISKLLKGKVNSVLGWKRALVSA